MEKVTLLLLATFVILSSLLSEREVYVADEICWERVVETYKYEKEIADISRKIAKLNITSNVPENLPDIIYRASKRYDIPRDLLIALIYTESSFNQYAISYKDCVGYMQLNYQVHLWVCQDRMYEAEYNIMAGSKILRKYRNRSNSWEEALIRYNGFVPGSTFGRLVLSRKDNLRRISG